MNQKQRTPLNVGEIMVLVTFPAFVFSAWHQGLIRDAATFAEYSKVGVAVALSAGGTLNMFLGFVGRVIQRSEFLTSLTKWIGL